MILISLLLRLKVEDVVIVFNNNSKRCKRCKRCNDCTVVYLIYVYV